LRRTAGKSARPGHTVAFPSRKMHTEQPYGSFLGKRYHVRLTLGSSESSYCCGSGEKNGCGGCRDQGLIILARLAGKGGVFRLRLQGIEPRRTLPPFASYRASMIGIQNKFPVTGLYPVA